MITAETADTLPEIGGMVEAVAQAPLRGHG